MPKVTVVIPCYNHGRFLDEAVRSVLAQTYQDFEILVVDDGSNDSFTLDVLHNFKWEKTTVLHKKNGHLSAARNHGIARTVSEYILTLDADDRFAPAFLEKAVALLDASPQAGAVTCWSLHFGAKNKIDCDRSGGGLKDFLVHNPCHASCLFRKRCWEEVGGFDETMKQGYEDWNFWLAITKRGWHVASIPEPLFFYRVTKHSMVAHSDQIRPELVRQLVRNHLEVYREHVDEVVFEEERIIQRQQQELDRLRGSTACRIGRCFTQPVSVFLGLLRRIKDAFTRTS